MTIFRHISGEKRLPVRKKKKVGIATKVFVAIFAVYAAFTLVSLQIQISEKKQEQAELRQLLERQQIRNDELEGVIKDGANEEYIAKVARESLDYIYPGEKIFVDISSK